MVILAERTGNRIHVIDDDYRRRARIVHELTARSFHAEIYEDLDEFSRHAPQEGVVFAADDPAAASGPVEIAEVLQAHGAALPIVVYSTEPSTERIVDAIRDGALDYLEWPFDPLLLDKAFHRLAINGQQWSEQARLRSAAKARVEALSRREREVLVHLTRGLSNNDMAEALKISPRTVEIHRGKMMRKLEANSVADAVRIALYAGLDEDLVFSG